MEKQCGLMPNLAAEVPCLIFGVVDDFFSLWSLRETCRSFKLVIAANPILGRLTTPPVGLFFSENTKASSIEWRAVKGKLMKEVLVNQQLEERVLRAQVVLKHFTSAAGATKKKEPEVGCHPPLLHLSTSQQSNRNAHWMKFDSITMESGSF